MQAPPSLLIALTPNDKLDRQDAEVQPSED